jgi:hypothetical protein
MSVMRASLGGYLFGLLYDSADWERALGVR